MIGGPSLFVLLFVVFNSFILNTHLKKVAQTLSMRKTQERKPPTEMLKQIKTIHIHANPLKHMSTKLLTFIYIFSPPPPSTKHSADVRVIFFSPELISISIPICFAYFFRPPGCIVCCLVDLAVFFSLPSPSSSPSLSYPWWIPQQNNVQTDIKAWCHAYFTHTFARCQNRNTCKLSRKKTQKSERVKALDK